MSNRVQLSLRVPEQDVKKYEEALDEKFGQKAPYAGTELEREIRAFLGQGETAKIESEIDRLVKAAGVRPKDSHEINTPIGRTITEGPTRVISYRIHPDVRSAFMHFVEVECDTSAGRMIGKIMSSYAEGGVSARIRRKTERFVEDAERLLSVNDPDSDGRLNRRKQRIQQVCSVFNDSRDVHKKDLESAIRNTGISSRQSIEEYTEEVLDNLGLVKHPKVDNLFLQPRDIQSLKDSSPTDPAPLYDELDRAERVVQLQVELCKRALENGDKYSVDADDVESDIFNNKPSTGYAYKLMEIAAESQGFEYKSPQGKKRLQADVNKITNTRILTQVDDGTSDTKRVRARLESEQLKQAEQTEEQDQ